MSGIAIGLGVLPDKVANWNRAKAKIFEWCGDDVGVWELLSVKVVFLWFDSKGEIHDVFSEELGSKANIVSALTDDVDGVTRLIGHRASDWNF